MKLLNIFTSPKDLSVKDVNLESTATFEGSTNAVSLLTPVSTSGFDPTSWCNIGTF